MAGREYGYSPATASAKLAILENHYGAKLIHRTTRSLNLTDEGFVLLERARQIVADAKDLKQTIQYGVNKISGIIKDKNNNIMQQEMSLRISQNLKMGNSEVLIRKDRKQSLYKFNNKF